MAATTEGIAEVAGLVHDEALALRGARIFVTGATGFYGRWLLELLAFLNDRHALQLAVHGLSRNPDAFAQRAPELAAHPMITWHRGDVNALSASPTGSLTHVLHLAAETDARLYDADPVSEVMTSVEGSRRVAQIARASSASRVLFASSGAVYGPQPLDVDRLSEQVRLGPEPTSTVAAHAYGQGKRMAETLLCLEATRAGSPFSVSLARGFAFSGAHLALDRHFAIGNFVRDAHAGGPVVVGGDGTPLRSYLDGADLARWLLVLLVRGGAQRAYNVGSDDAVSIASLAEEAAAFTGVPVVVRGGPPPAGPVARYVPSIERARRELGLDVSVPRRESLARMFRALGRRVD